MTGVPNPEPATGRADDFCPGCLGAGRWETECCDGSRGCSCRGQRIDMGYCNVCGGSGFVTIDCDPMANVNAISGYCFIGSGPSSGYWAGKPSMGRAS